MSINLDNVKAITHNNKDVIKIEDSQGRIIWQLPSTSEILYYSIENAVAVIQKKLQDDAFSDVTWGTYRPLKGNSIWSDGDYIYYSESGNNYVFNESTTTWSETSFNGMNDFDGNNVWTDGTNIYYSSGTTQKVLDKNTKTWSDKTWINLTNFGGNNVWTAAGRIFYSSSGTNYELNVSTDTWTSFSFTPSITSIAGYQIWTDGTNIYWNNYSSNTGQMRRIVLDYNPGVHALYTCGSNGTNKYMGSRTFKYKGDIYMIESASPYQMYKLTSSNTSQVTWTRFDFTNQPSVSTEFRGDRFWDKNGRSSAGSVAITKKTV